ncbi:MAG: response regulator [Chloroflexi bacterium]|nr:response regulator [Chloroflexota bacterium]
MSLVYVIEDELSLATLYLEIMKRAGFSGTMALDGNYALVLLEQEVPDVIILDLMLPGLSGLDVLRYIRSTPRLEDVYVVVTTADYMAGHEVHELADQVLVKPVHIDVLRDVCLRVA